MSDCSTFDVARIVPTRSLELRCSLATLALVGASTTSALAGTTAIESMFSFHLMQIEAVIGGINGDTTAQAVELRTRSAFQSFISGKRIMAYDAAGLNPVMLVEFPTNINNSNAGTRILVATSSFVSSTTPNAQPDFMMTNTIPESYFAAGRITFEDDFGTVIWSLAYGGSGYTGLTTGSLDNDLDGDYGPPFDGPLPSTSTQALHFQGLSADRSTSNSDDYALTPGPAVFFNVSGGHCAVGDGSIFGFEVVGHCPGTVNLTWSGATPSRNMAIIFASNQGNVPIPNGSPCAGTRLGLGTQNIQLVQTLGSGTDGINSINGNTSNGACGGFLQLLDLTSCRTSNVERIP